MTEAKNSFLGSKMNKDLDDRLIPNNEYRHAENITISKSEGSDMGAIESILGADEVAGSISGCVPIGYFADENGSNIYYFVTSNYQTFPAPSNTTHKIVKYSALDNSVTTLVEGSFLSFTRQNKILGVNLVEDMLFWTDGINPPRKINVVSALQPGYYSNADQISVCKFAPYEAPSFINLKSQSALQPSTMSNKKMPSVVDIGASGDWGTGNLDVDHFSNGDKITHARTATEWTNAESNNLPAWCYSNDNPSDQTRVGKLYNRHAVNDSRGLAPAGWSIPTEAQWDDLMTSSNGGDTGVNAADSKKYIKNTSGWTNAIGNENELGWSGSASGWRDANGAYEGITSDSTWADDQASTWWVSGATKAVKTTDNTEDLNKQTKKINTTNGQGHSVRVIRGAATKEWRGDPELLKERFVRFSYRFKFDDNEYSLIAPFSQDCFVPLQEGVFGTGDQESILRSTLVEFMTNEINNVIINIPLPSEDVKKEYNIKEIDIIYKESDALAYKVLQSVNVDDDFKTKLQGSNIFQYTYESTIPYITLSTDETTRVYDNLPVIAKSQEVAGNRVMYGNVVLGYTAPDPIDYGVVIANKSLQTYTEYPNHSVKQNRNYTVGFVLSDKYGRQTDVILSSNDGKLNSDGTPVANSNVYSPYRNLGTNMLSWLGDNIQIQVNNIIPESGTSKQGYPGAYAVGDYWTTVYTTSTAHWRSKSTGISTAPTSGSTYVFTWVDKDDWVDTANETKIYTDTGSGWAEYKGTVGAISYFQGSTGLTIDLDTTNNPKYKVVCKFGDGNGNYTYKYTTQYLYDGYETNDTTKFEGTEEKWLRGEYCDFTKIVNVNKPSATPGAERFISTEKEINSRYLFNSLSDIGINAAGDTHVDGVYEINPNGFYSYRVVVKQQEQEYYNVYLPGIVNGTPIPGATTSEVGDVAFTTIVGDNINKIPRSLKTASDSDDKFTSDVKLFGKVTNVNITDVFNKQTVATTSVDEVMFIGSTDNVFKTDAGTATEFGAHNNTDNKINKNTIFDRETTPFVAKISTANPIGLTTLNFTDPAIGSNYSAAMNLAVYETAPVSSLLDIFYETSTTGLIADLNVDVKNEALDDLIDGTSINSDDLSFEESDPTNTTINSTPFWPQSNGVNVTVNTGQLLSVYSKDTGGNIVENNDKKDSFVLEQNTANGSWQLKTNDVFYAGPNNDTENFFIFVMKFWDANGDSSIVTLETEMKNSDPTITAPTTLPADWIVDEWNTTIINGADSNSVLLKGKNGSAWESQAANGLTWSIKTATNSTKQFSIPSSLISDYFTLQAVQGNTGTELYEYPVITVAENYLDKGDSWNIDLELKDVLGADETYTLSFTVKEKRYTDEVVFSGYNVSVNDPWDDYRNNLLADGYGQIASGSEHVQWGGEIQNWKDEDISIFVYNFSQGTWSQQNASRTLD